MNNFSVLVKMDGIRYFCVVITNLLNNKTMRANIEAYKAVEEAAMKFVKSVAEGNSTASMLRNCLLMKPSCLAIWTESWSMVASSSSTTMWILSEPVMTSRHALTWWMWRRPLPWSACWKRNGVAALTSLIICC